MRNSLIGSWLVEDIQGRGVIDSAQTTIAISAEGAVSGSGGCNRYRSQALIEGAGLRFGPVAGTRMSCAPALMDQEHKFFAALDMVRSYQFDGTLLLMLDESGAQLLRLTRQG